VSRYAIRVCSFDAVDLEGLHLSKGAAIYPEFRARVLEAGRFSAFEATATPSRARMFDRLRKDPELEVKSIGFPWITVRGKEPGNNAVTIRRKRR